MISHHRLTAFERLAMTLLVAVAVCLCAGSDIQSAQVWDKPTRGVFGVKLGMITGTETRGDIQVRTGWDKSIEVFADLPVTRPVALQCAFDFHSIRSNRVDSWMIDVNVAIKPTIHLRDKTTDIKPGVAVGYGRVGQFDSYFENTDYLTIRTFVEASFEMNRKYAWLAELSVAFANGGNDEYDIRVGPVFLLRFGIGMR